MPVSRRATERAWSVAFCTDSRRSIWPTECCGNCAQSPIADTAGLDGDEQRVDDDAVVAGEPRRARERVLGEHADADDDEVGGHAFAVGEHDRGGDALRALDRADADAEAKARAERLVRVEEEVRGRRRDGATERAGDLDHRHFAADRKRSGGDLEADEAGADHDDAPAGTEPLADRRRVGDVA